MVQKRVSFSDNNSVFEYEETEQERLQKRACIWKIHETIKNNETSSLLVFFGLMVLIVIAFLILFLCKTIL